MPTGQSVAVNVTNNVMTIELIDVERRNTLHSQMCAEFVSACERASADDDVRVVVVTNRGTVFCAGADLEQETKDESSGRQTQPALTEPGPRVADVFRAITNSPKPFVGRIAGHAVAGGTGLAAAMDISVALRDTTFGFSEVRIGVIPAIISVVCIPKMSRKDVSELFLRGTRFSASTACEVGLINYVADNDTLDGQVDEIVADLLEGGPLALAGAKQLVASIGQLSPDDAFAYTAELSQKHFVSNEGQHGMAAYKAKHPPRWSPRTNSTS